MIPEREDPPARFTRQARHGQVASAPRKSASSTTTSSETDRDQEDPIAIDSGSARTQAKAASWAYCEEFVPEDDQILRARERAADLGCPSIAAGVGSCLRAVVAAMGARAVVEIGTGAGVGSLWLLAGMPEDGVLTTIDADPDRQRAAKRAFTAAGIRSTRTRTIAGQATDVLPRLADGSYDLVLIGPAEHAHPEYIEQSLRLLRPGGMLAVDGALARDRVADPALRDEHTKQVRDLGRRLRDDDRVIPALLPLGDGLLVAVRR